MATHILLSFSLIQTKYVISSEKFGLIPMITVPNVKF